MIPDYIDAYNNYMLEVNTNIYYSSYVSKVLICNEISLYFLFCFLFILFVFEFFLMVVYIYFAIKGCLDVQIKIF